MDALDRPATLAYPAPQECEDSERSGIRTRQSRGFFVPGIRVMAGRATDTTPSKGKEVHRLRSVFNLPATPRSLVKTSPRGFNELTQETASMTLLPALGASAPIVFTFDTNSQIRIVLVSGEPWFVAADVAKALGYARTRDAVARHCKRAKSLSELTAAFHGGEQNQDISEIAKLIPEPDVYRLITGSKLPSAEAFDRLVFEEILPSIRKTGRYQATQAAPTPEYLTNAEQTTVAYLVAQICRGRRLAKAWTFGTWKAIRRVSRSKSPMPLEVAHIPAVATELERVYTAVSTFDEAVHKAEKEFLRRVFRNGEDAATVVAQIEARILTPALSAATDFSLTLAAWKRRDIVALRNRQARTFPVAAPPEGMEPKEAAC